MTKSITVVGAGSWGTALAQVLCDNGHDVKLYDLNQEIIDDINRNHHNSRFFKELMLPDNLKGTTNLSECGTLKDHIIKYNEQGKWLAAICAAPSIFSSLGILKDKRATSFPSFADKMECKEYGGGVVRDGNIITGKGLGVALELGLELISCLIDEETSGKIADQIQYN